MFCEPRLNPYFNTFATASVNLPAENEEILYMVSYSRASGEGKRQSHCEQIDEDDLFLSPLALRARSLQKDLIDNVGGRECQKGKEKRTKVC